MSEKRQGKPKPKERIVSAARSKDPKQPVSIRLTAQQVKELDAAAGHRHLSRSDLIVQAISRCLADDVWTAGEGQRVSGNAGRSSRDHLAELANVLVSLGYAVGEALESRSRQRKEEAMRVLADAQHRLNDVMIALRC